MTNKQKTLRDAAIAAAVSNLKPVKFNTFQSLHAAWQVYRAAKAAPRGGGGPAPVK
jgi:hypothetical protein